RGRHHARDLNHRRGIHALLRRSILRTHSHHLAPAIGDLCSPCSTPGLVCTSKRKARSAQAGGIYQCDRYRHLDLLLNCVPLNSASRTRDGAYRSWLSTTRAVLLTRRSPDDAPQVESNRGYRTSQELYYQETRSRCWSWCDARASRNN